MLQVDLLILCRRETFGPTHRPRSPLSFSLKKPQGKHPSVGSDHSVLTGDHSSTSYSRVAYCAVTGRESRLPLKIRGQGVGPQIQLSFDTLDIQNVFVNSSHAYEVETVYCSALHPLSTHTHIVCSACTIMTVCTVCMC